MTTIRLTCPSAEALDAGAAACAAGATSSAAVRAAPRVMRFTGFLPGADEVMPEFYCSRRSVGVTAS